MKKNIIAAISFLLPIALSSSTFAQVDPSSLKKVQPIQTGAVKPSQSKPEDIITDNAFILSDDQLKNESQILKDALNSSLHSKCMDYPMSQMRGDLFALARRATFEKMGTVYQGLIDSLGTGINKRIFPDNMADQLTKFTQNIDDIQDKEMRTFFVGTNALAQFFDSGYSAAGNIMSVSIPVEQVMTSSLGQRLLGNVVNAFGRAVNKAEAVNLDKANALVAGLPLNAHLTVGLVTVPTFHMCMVYPSSPLYLTMKAKFGKTAVGVFHLQRSMFLFPNLMVMTGSPGWRFGYGRIYGDLNSAEDFEGHAVGASQSIPFGALKNRANPLVERMIGAVGNTTALGRAFQLFTSKVPSAFLNYFGLNVKAGMLFDSPSLLNFKAYKSRNIGFWSTAIEIYPTPITAIQAPEIGLAPWLVNVGQPWNDKKKLMDFLVDVLNPLVWTGIQQSHAAAEKEEAIKSLNTSAQN